MAAGYPAASFVDESWKPPMNPEIATQVRNVQKFGRLAAPFCVLFEIMLVILSIWAIYNIITGPTRSDFRVGFGAYDITGDNMTTVPVKLWSVVVWTTVFGMLLKGIFHLHQLFNGLGRGEIYTKANVVHIRQVGLLALALAVVQLVLPMVSWLLVEIGFIDAALVTSQTEAPRRGILFGSGSLSPFITASLVLLASWIMDVGRQTSEDAAEMRREADLVI
jgi:hypothetical protein